MAFTSSYNAVFPRENEPINGDKREISCISWFPSGNDPYPISFKFIGDDSEVVTVRDIKIITKEDKNYSGIPSKEYTCKAVIGGLIHKFKLIFYLEACKWIMVI